MMEDEDHEDRPNTGCGFLAALASVFARIRQAMKNKSVRQRRRNLRIIKIQEEERVDRASKDQNPGQDLGETEDAGEDSCRALTPQRFRKRRRNSSGKEVRPSFKRRYAGQDLRVTAGEDSCRAIAVQPQKGSEQPNPRALCYTVAERLGQGGFGSVYAGIRNADGEQVAIKIVKRANAKYMTEPKNGTSLPKEVALMEMVPQHPNICQLLEWFQGQNKIGMVLERPQPCMDLREYCHRRRLREQEASAIMRQVVLAAKHCHTHGVLHRDIKADNILINTDNNLVKLIDFGCGDILRDGPYESFSGTAAYMPPELLVQGTYEAEPATVWSLGVLLYFVVKGVLPFCTEEEIVEKQIRKRLRKLSPDCRNLILTCLRKDPSARPSLESILRHRWLGGLEGKVI